jgi:dTDP-4-amino-4,6-dideoxygalactose transaminase
MTDIGAAVGRAQLAAFEGMQARRHEIANAYERGLSPAVTTPYVSPDARHGYHLYTIRCQDRERVIRALAEEDIGYGIWYETPVHLMPEYRDGGAVLPETESAAREVLALPIRPDLTDEEVETIMGAVNRGVA